MTDSCVDLFTSCGFAVRVLDLNGQLGSQSHNLAGFIGFAGAVRGSLMISGPSEMFRASHPATNERASLSRDALFDWTGELANQLLGRVKRRFCERGRDFDASTPTAIEGRELYRRFPGRTGVLDLSLSVGASVASVCFEVTPPADSKVFPDDPHPIEVSQEGDLVLF